MLSPGEISILASLSDGPKRFGALKRETGLTPRWLSKKLESFIKENKVVRHANVKEGLVEYELTPEEHRKLDPMFRAIAGVEKKSAMLQAEMEPKDPVEQVLTKIFLTPALLFLPAVLADYYGEEEIYEFLKKRSSRILEDAFDSVLKISRHTIDEFFQTQHSLDLRKLTYAEALKKIPAFSDHFFERAPLFS